MKAVIAIDSFKGSLTSLEAGNAARSGILRVLPDAEVIVKSIADGGEGTVEALCTEIVSARVHDPLGRLIDAEYGILRTAEKPIAVIEMAKASGLTLLDEAERDPWETSTEGVGELILDALYRGIRDFIIGIGGSATNDGGVGMLAVLGYGLIDAAGRPIEPCCRGLKNLSEIIPSEMDVLKKCRFRVACDVTNPLFGSKGCSAVFAPQKGANTQDIGKMDDAISRYSFIAQQLDSSADPWFPGSGAAGGLGFALHTFLKAEMQSGVSLILDAIGLEDEIRDCDLVICGEGRLDAQTVMGKAPIGVAALAKKHGKPCIAFAGCVTPQANVCNEHGITAFFPIIREPKPLDELMQTETAARNLSATVEQVMRAMSINSFGC